MLEGKGVMAWQLKSLPSAETFAKLMEYYGMDWVSFKMANNSYPYNWSTVDSAAMDEYIDQLIDRGVRVGMWHYTDGADPKAHGAMAARVVKQFPKLNFIQVDAEGGQWNKWGSDRRAKEYLDNCYVPGSYSVSLCSYRFPKYFPQFPFKGFVEHSRMRGEVSPQVYWEFSHNPYAQVRDSFNQYRDIIAGPLFFVPIAPCYFRGVPGAVGSWGPTPEDLRSFVNQCNNMNLPGWGVYSWDKIWQHWEDYGHLWMQALTGKPKPSETPPSPPPPSSDTVRLAEVKAHRLNVRRSPEVNSNNKWTYTQLSKGMVVAVIGKVVWNGSENRAWARIGGNMYACMRDWDGTELMMWTE